jgi:RNA polymerase sigma-70 factor (ECF subfamily)
MLQRIGKAMSEESLVARSRAGDLDAFNQLVLTYQNPAYRLAFYLLCNEELAIEVVRDSFTRAFKALDTLQRGNFRNWLMRIVADCACDLLHKHQSCPAVRAEALQVARNQRISADSASCFPQKAAKTSELREQLAAEIHSLPVNQRMALILSDICGFSYADIDEVCNVAPGTARSCLSQARGRLRDFLYRDENGHANESRLR